MLEDKALVKASLHTAHHQASFLAASSQQSGDWLFALPIASCRLKLDDEAVRVAVGLRLGLDLCVPHNSHCGSPVDARGLHSFVCKRAPGRSARHHALNDLVARSFASAGVPVTKEPAGLCRSDGKRPDGVSLVPWQSGNMERHGHLPTGRVIRRQSISPGRCSSRVGGHSQRGQIC